jgi:branched-chain amino acid transport system ATP-binding protein
MNEMTAPLSPTEGYTTADGRKIGGVVMEMKNITLRFGGVEAIKDISFDIREGEIRAIIGPNGAGKSSDAERDLRLLPSAGGRGLVSRGAKRPPMKPYQIAQQGIARTFQNIALFEGMSVLDNVMTGRLNHMNASFLDQAFWWGKAQREEVANRRRPRKSSISSRSRTSARRRWAACPMA